MYGRNQPLGLVLTANTGRLKVCAFTQHKALDAIADSSYLLILRLPDVQRCSMFLVPLTLEGSAADNMRL